jgi:hypothetical protein
LPLLFTRLYRRRQQQQNERNRLRIKEPPQEEN